MDDEFHGPGLLKYNNGAQYEGGKAPSTRSSSCMRVLMNDFDAQNLPIIGVLARACT